MKHHNRHYGVRHNGQNGRDMDQHAERSPLFLEPISSRREMGHPSRDGGPECTWCGLAREHGIHAPALHRGTRYQRRRQLQRFHDAMRLEGVVPDFDDPDA